MHSQEPWQSRSPTGSVNKPSISSTLGKTGRKGPHHSYGRGLPVKRKALVILTVAILAFAMIPAIGAGAASAEIKIVTPPELANPSDNDGSAFENLAAAGYVSDVTGRTNMADTYGTLYAVIEDNDADANKLTTYTAYFAAAGSRDASADFDVAAAGTVVHRGSHERVQPAADADTLVTGDDLTALRIADRNKDGEVGSEDVTIYLAVGTGGPGENVTTSKLPQRFVIDAVGSDVTVNLDTRGLSATGGVRVEFATAGQDTRTAEVRSAAGDSITIDVEEKNLSYYAELDNTVGVTSAEFGDPTVRAATPDDDDSVDSGIFVGSFGLIRNGWKDMISDWATDATTDEPTIKDASPSPNIDPVASPVPTTSTTDGAPPTHPDVRALLVDIGAGRYIVDANNDRKIDHNDVSAQFKALTGNTYASGGTGLSSIEPTTGVTATITSLSARGTAATETITCEVHADSGQTAPTADPSATQRVACVNIVGPATGTTFDAAGRYVTGDPTDAADITTTPVGAGFDMVEFTFTTEPSTQALLDAVEEDVAADIHEAFGELDDDRSDLHTALEEQARNLGIAVSTGEPASDLVGRLLGVLDKGIVEVRYSDPKPKTTRRGTAIVDLAAPTVGGFNPAKGSFTTEDSFEVLFSVSDNGAGIPEDAEDDDENTVGNTSLPLVDVTIDQPDGGTITEADLTPGVSQTRETVTDGYQYETNVDVDRDTDNDENITVTVNITAYDLAGNKADVEVTYIIDTKDPQLLGALTGVGAKLNNKLARDTKATPTLGAYEVIENDPRWVALVFDNAINGALLEPAEIIIAGETVETLLWLDGSGANVVTTEGDAKNRETITEDNGAGLDLDSSGTGQDARSILFVKLSADLDTSARPAIEIDAADLEDLAGNQDRTDHTLTRAHDRLSPKLTVTVANKLSNNDLDVNIESTEDLRRIPSASITKIGDNPTDRSLTVKRVGSGWTIEAKAKSIGQTTGGVRTISVSAEDEDGNKVTKTATWELDVEVANPTRVGATDGKAHSIETNPVTFLSLKFEAEADEYGAGNGVDSSKTVNITGASLETLSAGSVKANGDIAATADIEVTGTTEVDDAALQSSDQITHVAALTDLALGNYRLQVSFADAAGNTGKFGYVFKITAPAPAKVTVVPGWSLVSIPGTPQDKSIGGVLEGSSITDVWSLNNETKVWEFARHDENGEWMGTLTQIVDGRAYFVRSTTFDPISVLTERFSPQRTPSQYVVTSGWNGIGYTPAGNEKSISVDGYLSSLGASGWGMIRTWNASATPPQYETYFSSGAMTDGFPADNSVAKVERGKGYLLFATRNGVIGG